MSFNFPFFGGRPLLGPFKKLKSASGFRSLVIDQPEDGPGSDAPGASQLVVKTAGYFETRRFTGRIYGDNYAEPEEYNNFTGSIFLKGGTVAIEGRSGGAFFDRYPFDGEPNPRVILSEVTRAGQFFRYRDLDEDDAGIFDRKPNFNGQSEMTAINPISGKFHYAHRGRSWFTVGNNIDGRSVFSNTGLMVAPYIVVNPGTDIVGPLFSGCSDMIEFPGIELNDATQVNEAWEGCSFLSEFPYIETSSILGFFRAWKDCSFLLSFPAIDITKASDLSETWMGCWGLASFPSMGTLNNLTTAFSTWQNCEGLESWGATNFPVARTLSSVWEGCSSLKSFPAIDIGSCQWIKNAWAECWSMVSFPALNYGAITSPMVSDFNMLGAWRGCSFLESHGGGFAGISFESGNGAMTDAGTFGDCPLNRQSLLGLLSEFSSPSLTAYQGGQISSRVLSFASSEPIKYNDQDKSLIIDWCEAIASPKPDGPKPFFLTLPVLTFSDLVQVEAGGGLGFPIFEGNNSGPTLEETGEFYYRDGLGIVREVVPQNPGIGQETYSRLMARQFNKFFLYETFDPNNPENQIYLESGRHLIDVENGDTTELELYFNDPIQFF